ncbi:MAG: GFA family protein [Myxococcota bacterium]
MTHSASQPSFIGGCLCGQLRYEASDLIDAGYCHCRLCQRSSGGPVLAWASLLAGRFIYTQGEPARYASSGSGRREFCARCGTQIAFRNSRTPDRVDLNIASLDDPARVEPQYHIWVASQISWFEIDDNLPRYAGEGPDSPSA